MTAPRDAAPARQPRQNAPGASRAYLVTTGTLFGALAVLHLARAVALWPRVRADPAFILGTAAEALVTGALGRWAWRLLRSPTRS